jgi:S-DNA-T family DNA segregation ATPase FtsK/SpoIIIE
MPPIRGINGWLKSMHMLRVTKIDYFGGSTIGIDAVRFFSGLLVKDPWAAAVGHTDTAYVTTLVNDQLERFADADIVPIFVFPGVSSLPRLAADHTSAAPSSGAHAGHDHAQDAGDMQWALNDRDAASRDRAWEELRCGNTNTAESYFAQIEPSFTPATRSAVLAALHAAGAQVLTAPHRVAAQLAWLDQEPQKATHASFGLHELLLHRVGTVVTSLDLAAGTATFVSLSEVLASQRLTHTQFVHACLLAGHASCQTFPAVYDDRGRFNFPRALTLVRAAKGSLTQAFINAALRPTDHNIFAAAANKMLDRIEGARVLTPGLAVVTARRLGTERVPIIPLTAAAAAAATLKAAATAAIAEHDATTTTAAAAAPGATALSTGRLLPPVPAAAQPAGTLPRPLLSLLVTGAVSASTVAAWASGNLCDAPPALPSRQLPVLLDSLAPIRAQALALLSLATAAAAGTAATAAAPSKAAAAKASDVAALGAALVVSATVAEDASADAAAAAASAARAAAPAGFVTAAAVPVNARWYDEAIGEWPRPLAVPASAPLAGLAAAAVAAPADAAPAIAAALAPLRAAVDAALPAVLAARAVAGTCITEPLAATAVLSALASTGAAPEAAPSVVEAPASPESPVDPQDEAEERATVAAAALAAAVTLWLAGFVTAAGVPTTAGKCVVAALAPVSEAAAQEPLLPADADALLSMVFLLRADVIDTRPTVQWQSAHDADRTATVPAATEAPGARARCALLRVLAALPAAPALAPADSDALVVAGTAAGTSGATAVGITARALPFTVAVDPALAAVSSAAALVSGSLRASTEMALAALAVAGIVTLKPSAPAAGAGASADPILLSSVLSFRPDHSAPSPVFAAAVARVSSAPAADTAGAGSASSALGGVAQLTLFGAGARVRVAWASAAALAAAMRAAGDDCGLTRADEEGAAEVVNAAAAAVDADADAAVAALGSSDEA